MKTVRLAILIISAAAVLFSGNGLAAEKEMDKECERHFQFLDKNHDGKISKEEWNAIDTNGDGKITPEEWERYHFKSSSTVRWIDTNSDGYMDRDEFRNNCRR